MAYKRLSEVDSVSTFNNLIAINDGKVVQISDDDFNKHYGIGNITGDLYSVAKDKADGIIQSAEGSMIIKNDTSDDYIRGLHIYGASTQDGTPTLEDPIDIVSIGDSGNIIVDICGKNLVSMSAFDSMFSNGVTNTYDASTHTIILSDDVTTNVPSGRYCVPRNHALKIGVSYTLSFDIRGTAGKTVSCGWDRNRSNITLTGAFKRYQFTRVADAENLAVSFYTINTADGGLGVGEYMQFANVQIEVGDTATQYQEYVDTQSITISTPNGLRGIGVTYDYNYQDQNDQNWIGDEIDIERGVILNRCKKIVCTGEEEWSASSTYNAYVLGLPETSLYGLSTHMVSITAEQLQNGDEGVYLTYSGYIICNIKDKFDSVDVFKAWLADQYANGTPVTFIYCVEKHTETPLSDDEILTYKDLHTNYLGTTVMNDVGAHMKLSYNTDTKTYIDNKFEELKALITS